MTSKDVKEITYIPLVTFFSVLERPGKTVRGLQQPPLVRRGLNSLVNQHGLQNHCKITLRSLNKLAPNTRSRHVQLHDFHIFTTSAILAPSFAFFQACLTNPFYQTKWWTSFLIGKFKRLSFYRVIYILQFISSKFWNIVLPSLVLVYPIYFITYGAVNV